MEAIAIIAFTGWGLTILGFAVFLLWLQAKHESTCKEHNSLVDDFDRALRAYQNGTEIKKLEAEIEEWAQTNKELLDNLQAEKRSIEGLLRDHRTLSNRLRSQTMENGRLIIEVKALKKQIANKPPEDWPGPGQPVQDDSEDHF